jgi:hypothetical protein
MDAYAEIQRMNNHSIRPIDPFAQNGQMCPYKNGPARARTELLLRGYPESSSRVGPPIVAPRRSRKLRREIKQSFLGDLRALRG